jgi:hypothetical protein
MRQTICNCKPLNHCHCPYPILGSNKQCFMNEMPNLNSWESGGAHFLWVEVGQTFADLFQAKIHETNHLQAPTILPQSPNIQSLGPICRPPHYSSDSAMVDKWRAGSDKLVGVQNVCIQHVSKLNTWSNQVNRLKYPITKLDIAPSILAKLVQSK